MESQNNAPDTSSGQGAAPSVNTQVQTPNVAHGQANPNSSSTGQSQGLPPEILQELDKRTSHYNQKITEMGQTNAQLRQQVEQYNQRQQQLAQSIAQQFGFAQQPQQPDIANMLFDNPQELFNLLREEAGKEYNPRIEQLEQERAVDRSEKFLESQDKQRMIAENRIRETITSDPKLLEQILDIKPYLDQKVIQLNQRLNDPTTSYEDRVKLDNELKLELAKGLQRAGGYEALVDRNLGKLFRDNPSAITHSLAQVMRQKQMQGNRTQAYSNFTGGAPTQAGNQGNGIQFSSESVFR